MKKRRSNSWRKSLRTSLRSSISLLLPSCAGLVACISAGTAEPFSSADFRLSIEPLGSLRTGQEIELQGTLTNISGARREVYLGFPRKLSFRHVATEKEWVLSEGPPIHDVHLEEELLTLRPGGSGSWAMRTRVPHTLPPGEYRVVASVVLAPTHGRGCERVVESQSLRVHIDLA